MDIVAETPLCSVCDHRHEQGVKCSVCGHTGKSRVFHLLKMKSMAGAFTVRGFDCLTRTPSIHNLDRGLYAFTKILRGRIFSCNELPADLNARHLVAFVGDAPIGTARWRMTLLGNEFTVEIDNIGILEPKRRQGFGKQFLLHTLTDIDRRLRELDTPCVMVQAFIPDSVDTVAALKLFEALGFKHDGQRVQRDSQAFFRMVLHASS
ncbi:hypothetical protein ATCC90586_005932 [Pythium insidiosum]|nr:hypothetical protein ATCC90586_005932 [Pythium insidiosum]